MAYALPQRCPDELLASTMTRAEMKVWLAVRKVQGDNAEAWARMAHYATMTGLDKSVVSRALAVLKAAGWIEATGGGYRCTVGALDLAPVRPSRKTSDADDERDGPVTGVDADATPEASDTGESVDAHATGVDAHATGVDADATPSESGQESEQESGHCGERASAPPAAGHEPVGGEPVGHEPVGDGQDDPPPAPDPPPKGRRKTERPPKPPAPPVHPAVGIVISVLHRKPTGPQPDAIAAAVPLTGDPPGSEGAAADTAALRAWKDTVTAYGLKYQFLDAERLIQMHRSRSSNRHESPTSFRPDADAAPRRAAGAAAGGYTDNLAALRRATGLDA